MKRPRRVITAQFDAAMPGDSEGSAGGALSPDAELPLIDSEVLRDLEEQLGDAALARSFAADFLDATASRVTRLEVAVAARDVEAAMDAILGVKTTSMMVGAVALGRVATECQSTLQAGSIGGMTQLLSRLRLCSEQTTVRLRETYLSR